MLELIKYMGTPLWSSVPGGRDALDLLCITFSAYQVLHDSSLLFCAEGSVVWFVVPFRERANTPVENLVDTYENPCLCLLP